MTEVSVKETLPVAEIFLRHVALLKTKMFYWTVTITGFFTGLFLLVAIGDKANPYHVHAWAFWLIFASTSVLVGLTMWLARETKYKAKETLPPIPTQLSSQDLAKIQEELNGNKLHKKLQKLDLARTITIFMGIAAGFFLVQDMWGATTLLPTIMVFIQLGVSILLITTGIVLHMVTLSIQKHSFQIKSETSPEDVEAIEDAQPHT